MEISFGQPWALLLLPLAMGGVFYVWRRGSRGRTVHRSRASLVIRLLLFSTVILALSAPTLLQAVTKQAIVFVADLSTSTVEQHTEIKSFIREATKARKGGDKTAVVAVGRNAMVDTPLSGTHGFSEFRAVVDSDYTNLASGLRLAEALLPQDAQKRIVLLSDGRQNLGDVLKEAQPLLSRGIRVDVVLLDKFTGPEALVEALDVPSSANVGERIPVRVRITSTTPGRALLRLSLDNRTVVEVGVLLKRGMSEFDFEIPVEERGLYNLSATLEAEGDTLVQNNRADILLQVEGAPLVLVVEGSPGAGTNISRALGSTGLESETRSASDFPNSLQELQRYKAVVLVDVPAKALSDLHMQLIQTAVRDLGKGLVAIGGEQSFTAGEYEGSPLEEVLPVKSQVPRTGRSEIVLALLVDKSGSMAAAPTGGKAKIEMAKTAAIGALEELLPDDLVGVLAFDADNHWLVPIQKIGEAENLKKMQRAIASLLADGGTDFWSALSTASAVISDFQVPRKHIILLTDGHSLPGDFDSIVAGIKEQNITVSTIGIGDGADVDLLTMLAKEGQGRFYFVERSQDIPRIVIQETRLATRPAIVEEAVQAQVAGSSPVLDVIGRQFPTLEGYVVTRPKSVASVVLVSERGDPLLAQWQYGLGRSIAWTSDSQGRWTQDLNAWELAGRFWSALVDWTIPPEQLSMQLQTSFSQGTGYLVVEGETPKGAKLTARILTPELERIEVPLKASAPARYEATFQAVEQGVYMVQVTEESPSGERRSLTQGLSLPYSTEYRDLEPDPDLLEEVAIITGGEVLTDPTAAFARNLPTSYGQAPLTWWLLMLATLLLPVDVAVRRMNVDRLR